MSSAPNKRIFGLDLLRAIAILTVVFAHGKFFLIGTKLEGFPYIKLLDGVELFFVLSGFLIGSILLKDIENHQKYTFKNLSNFWRRRWFRTLPNYYLVLLLNYIVVRFGIIKQDITKFNFHFLTFTQNFSKPFYGFFWESWSLSIEEWFYILAPLLLLLLYRNFSLRRSFLLVSLTMIVFSLLYRASLYDPQMDDFTFDITIRKMVVTRLDSIGFGLLAAWIFKYLPSFWNQNRRSSLVIGLVLIIFILNFDSPSSSHYRQIFYFTFVPFSVMLLLPFFQNFHVRPNAMTQVIVHISKISYSMYLINLALVAEVIRDNFYPDIPGYGITKYLLFWCITIIASSLLYRYYEKPIMDLRDRRF